MSAKAPASACPRPTASSNNIKAGSKSAASRARQHLRSFSAGQGCHARRRPRSRRPPRRRPCGRGTLLLVEDEEIVRRPIGIYLRKLGYQVIEAANGNQAFSLWRQHRDQIDLLYTDMVMPEGVTGLDLAEKLKGEKPSAQGHHLQRLQHRNQHARRPDRRRLCLSAQTQPLGHHRRHHPRLPREKISRQKSFLLASALAADVSESHPCEKLFIAREIQHHAATQFSRRANFP